MPGTFVQPDGDPRLELVAAAADGPKRLVTVIPVRLNASGKALTAEVRVTFESVHVCACVFASAPVARPVEAPSPPLPPPFAQALAAQTGSANA